jgi:hypothetical protein
LEENRPLELKVKEKNKEKTLEHRLKEVYQKMNSKKRLEVPDALPLVTNVENIINSVTVNKDIRVSEILNDSKETYYFKQK